MRHIIWANKPKYETAILVKHTAFQQSSLEQHYINPIEARGYSKDNIIAFDLEYTPGNKAPVGFCKAYLSNLMPGLKKLGVKYLYVADSNYFKVLTKGKAEAQLGYDLPCTLPGYEDMRVILGINYQALTYNPNVQESLDLSITTISSVLNGTYKALGSGIIKWSEYPRTEHEIDAAFAKMKKWPHIYIDTETFSLHAYKAGLGTIGFSPDKTGGIVMHCDIIEQAEQNHRIFNTDFRRKLRNFFEEYKGRIIFHRCTYDFKVLIANLWMRNPLDNAGLRRGLNCLTRNFDDTLIIAYLATNSTAGNVLGLKSLAHEFAGNWAKDDINNIMLIKLRELMQYNLIDCMSTAYVYEKYYPMMVRDGQLKIYKEIMLPSIKTIVQIELTGMPMIPGQIKAAKDKLEAGLNAAIEILRATSYVKQAEQDIQKAAMQAANAKLKTKQHPLSAFSNVKFNPGSNQQLQHLLYNVMKLPVLDYTKSKQPATGGETIEKLVHHIKDPEGKALLKALVDYSKVIKILSSFIPAFEAGFDKKNGRLYLHGNFNLGGTLSGRLSSSDPNLQNLPSGSVFGKLIKSIFSAPDGWVMAGADFASLEDRINALLTQDPNKIKVYTDGFDGHALRTVAYFGDQITGIDVNSPESVNTIAEKSSPYYHLRQDSKAPTFALTYLGTWITLVKNCGFSDEMAKQIEANFHELYVVSGQWVNQKIEQASKDGYGTGAFGLRIRTPLLARSVMGSSKTLREAQAEGRSLGNAISGQSYGLLTNRAANKFMERVWASEFADDILPIALIHDAIYILVRKNPAAIKFANDNLIECMAWKGLPEISDPRVPLPANLDLYWPTWKDEITLDNNLSEQEIIDAVSTALKDRKAKAK